MQSTIHAPADPRLFLWIAIITAASVLFSLVFACATPFAAFAAAAALSLPRKQALILLAATWLANQVIGYVMLGYPQTINSFIWGAVIGVSALLAAYACCAVNARYEALPKISRSILVLVTGVLTYQALMLLALFTPLGDIRDFNAAVLSHVLLIDIGAFAALLVVNALGRNAGLLPIIQRS